MMPLGLGFAAISAWRIHAIHLFYIGGLGLLTMMIATRVVLAHGSRKLLLEQTSRALFPIVGLTLLAAFTRLSAGISAKIYLSHLAYAAGLWVLALGIWGYVFLKEGLPSRSGSADG
jgi:uncharacterized protein involved in response to NO